MLVGRDARCDITITDDAQVSPRHLTVAVRAVGKDLAAEILVTPLVGATLVNGRVISEATATKLGDTLQLGNTILEFHPDAARQPSPIPIRPNAYRPVLSANPIENTFLCAIRANPGDAAARTGYADWLEQHGLGDHAMFVRTAAHLEDPRYLAGCDVDWRAITSRTPIEHCTHASCPGGWDRLSATTDDDRARTCGTCRRRIHFIHDHFLVGDLRALGLPLARDASVATLRDDE